MRERIRTHRFDNGLTVVGEEMDFGSSVAVSVLTPAGAAYDPSGKEGLSYLLAQMLDRGAGAYGGRALVEETERYGMHYGHSSGMEVTASSASLLGENVGRAIQLLATMLRDPHLPEAELESVRLLALSELKSIEDEPASKAMVELSRIFYPEPFGRHQTGTEEGLRSITIEDLRSFFQERFVPDGAIIGVAGKFVWDEVLKEIEAGFGSWTGSREVLSVPPLRPESSAFHLLKETNQVQIALAYPSVGFESPELYTARVMVSVLSGGMAGRLFVEVREKRGLVYRVGASHSAARDRSAIFGFAGTTPDRSQETLDVMCRELRKIKQGVTADELERAKADLKSRVIMHGELSSARASAAVNDWYHLGRVRSLEEIKAGIDAVRDEDIDRHAEQNPPDPLTLVVLGPKPLVLPIEELTSAV